MPMRKSWDIADINRLGMLDFRMQGFEEGNEGIDILLITADRGYPGYYRAEIRFFNIAYIGCATYFDQQFIWRMATEEEEREIQAYAYRIPHARVCCVEEESISRKKFFLAYASVETTLLYADALEETYGTWGSNDL
jgi:hypothetical protein